ncbi:hypothetical protein D9611_000667 [Ephemerocybe angulata]|uniref:ATP-dependent DNA helicase n=1 Tax=Ephemerocybe angulata TaxID=980116 RepID=A0A8H5F6Q7_9AGAR|nr:hypothetical protein D9611_000667 [Tulosesus angulatus]
MSDITSVNSNLCYFRLTGIDTPYGTPVLEVASLRRLNTYLDVIDVTTNMSILGGHISNPTTLVIFADLKEFIRGFRFLQIKHLKIFAEIHKCVAYNRTKSQLTLDLSNHDCATTCPPVYIVLRYRARPRARIDQPFVQRKIQLPKPTLPTPPVITDNLSTAGLRETVERTTDTAHLTVMTDEDKQSVIKEWREHLSVENMKQSPCAICSRLLSASALRWIDPDSFDLALLRNEHIPSHLLPDDYNLVAYGGALLCADGLRSRLTKDDMKVCDPCLSDLRQGRMPKFSLANFLYYGRSRLPPEAATAFSESTCFERALVARARCNSLCARIPVSNTPEPGEERSSTVFWKVKKAIKGNVIVSPLDTTIRKLNPVLVRRTRVEQMLHFLLANNPYYRTVDGFKGFSADNLNSLFKDNDYGSPVQFGFLPTNPALSAANAGFTECNIATAEGREVEGILMENVGYTVSDETPVNYREMKYRAVNRCLSGKPFMTSRTGNRMVPDFDNPFLLSWLFPHLDPWGIGGFHHPLRQRTLTLEDQLRHLLQISDRAFQSDPEFAFVFYNIMRKKNVSTSLAFTVPVASYDNIIRDIMALDKDEVIALGQKYKQSPTYICFTETEKKISKVLASVGPVARRVPGSVGYKLSRRNEIRALINFRGAPTLFVTLTPSDLHSPIVSILAGRDVPSNEELESWTDETYQRALTAAKNPAACAKFFDIIVKSYVDIILRFGRVKPGLYGHCDAYYGVVEAQGRGTLHCHMLLWLRGHPAPSVLKDIILSGCIDYETKLKIWLDAIVQSGYLEPTATAAAEEARMQDARKDVGIMELHPGLNHIPELERLSANAFKYHFSKHVNRLLTAFNIHEHNATCWKYLKRGEKKTDNNCRLGMDGKVRLGTTIDRATGDVSTSRNHRMMSSFSDLCTALLQCNYNIKFAGSGDAANAFIHYATDYTAKPLLTMHAGLAALSYAMSKVADKQATAEATQRPSTLKAFTTVVNSMLGQQELSQQQVMSYFVGNGDIYTNEQFIFVNWARIVSEVEKAWSKLDGRSIADADSTTISLVPTRGNITVSDTLLDYIYRSDEAAYESMCLYHFVSSVKKKAMHVDANGIAIKGRAQSFFLEDHPQHHSQATAMRSKYVIPVLLGPRLPLCKTGGGDNEQWSRYVLVLFKPWRTPECLKQKSQSWDEAYASYCDEIEPRWKNIIDNMGTLAASREAAKEQKETRGTNIFLGEMVENIFGPSGDCYELNAFNNLENSKGHVEKEGTDLVGLKSILGDTQIKIFDSCYPTGDETLESDDQAVQMDGALSETVQIHRQHMSHLKKALLATRLQTSEAKETKTITERDIPPQVLIASLTGEDHPFGISTQQSDICEASMACVSEVVNEFSLDSNPEQHRAFRIISDHITMGGKQLLIYVGGSGGTGKSHVIKAIVALFTRLGRRSELLLGAPTGIAAVLIGGSTLHSLALINPSGNSSSNHKLQEVWRGVKYLVIDEISMVGARFLATFAKRVALGKGEHKEVSDTLFGGVNVIFTGDFCQLTPPKQQSLFSYRVAQPSFEQGSSNNGIEEMSGTYMWQKVDVVVKLLKNQRQATDSTFATVLSHIAMGTCRMAEKAGLKPGNLTIYEYLLSRELSRVKSSNPQSLQDFWDAPIIVGSKILRDRINARLIPYHAKRHHSEVHLYCSSDRILGDEVHEGLKGELWRLPSRKTSDMLGKLPLFIGMKVMVTDNIALGHGIVNGMEGAVTDIVYRCDARKRRIAEVVYIEIPNCGLRIPGLEPDVVPILPKSVTVPYNVCGASTTRASSFRRSQVPLVPSYAYTDYKSQGRSLSRAIIDLVTARGQGVYVMLSRVKTLDGLLILRWFTPTKIYQKMSPELKTELERLHQINEDTKAKLELWDQQQALSQLEQQIPMSLDRTNNPIFQT